MSLDVRLKVHCEHCGNTDELFSQNVTHNLAKMASEAGIYEALWRPEVISARLAEHLIEPLEAGLKTLKADPARFQTFNPKNGWGNYAEFVLWVALYLDACKKYPSAMIEVSS